MDWLLTWLWQSAVLVVAVEAMFAAARRLAAASRHAVWLVLLAAVLAWPFVAMDQAILDRAVDVQDALARKSQQRGAKIADSLIAAAAESAALVILHYDRDFDLIAGVTGQPTEWIVPPGTVP